MKLAEKVKRIRKEKGIKLREFQEKTGVPFGTVGHLEQGRIEKVSLHVICCIAYVLEITIDDLIKDTEYDIHRRNR